jgi:glycylpeptide N-tetradecanoyltransferase
MSIIEQMEPRARNVEQRRNVERLKHMLPLYEPHAFWDTQPVPKNSTALTPQKTETEGEIEHRDPKDVQKEPYSLPPGFEWSTVDVAADSQAEELYKLLGENYVEDNESTFRFDYPVEFIRWALMVPGYKKEWHVGVRSQKNKKLLAFISGTPNKIKVSDKTVKMASVNYLCVNKKLREKRLAPVLIKELTRRINLSSVYQAVFTAGIVIPRPIATASYYHRSLNPKKLIEAGFSVLPAGESMAQHLKKQKIAKDSEISFTSGFIREMTTKDIPQVYALLKQHLEKCKLAPKYKQEDVGHLLLPNDRLVYTYVVENDQDKKVTDFISFYFLPSQILQKDTAHGHTHINVINKPS